MTANALLLAALALALALALFSLLGMLFGSDGVLGIPFADTASVFLVLRSHKLNLQQGGCRQTRCCGARSALWPISPSPKGC